MRAIRSEIFDSDILPSDVNIIAVYLTCNITQRDPVWPYFDPFDGFSLCYWLHCQNAAPSYVPLILMFPLEKWKLAPNSLKIDKISLKFGFLQFLSYVEPIFDFQVVTLPLTYPFVWHTWHNCDDHVAIVTCDSIPLFDRWKIRAGLCLLYNNKLETV